MANLCAVQVHSEGEGLPGRTSLLFFSTFRVPQDHGSSVTQSTGQQQAPTQVQISDMQNQHKTALNHIFSEEGFSGFSQAALPAPMAASSVAAAKGRPKALAKGRSVAALLMGTAGSDGGNADDAADADAAALDTRRKKKLSTMVD